MKNYWIILITILYLFLSACGAVERGESLTADSKKADFFDDVSSEESMDSEKKKAKDVVDGVAVEVDSDSDSDGDIESDPSELNMQEGGGLLTAGEWSDLDDWAFWNNLMDTTRWANMMTLWKFSLKDRIPIIIKDKNGVLLNNISVTLQDIQGNEIWKAKTDVFGTAELWANIFGGKFDEFSIIVEDKLGNKQTFSKIEPSTEEQVFTFSSKQNNLNETDIMFVVDATGSMGDELEYLKTEIKNIINTVSERVAGINIRISLVFYRDQGEDYVVKDFGFETDLNKIAKNISNQSAAGGGDFPEAVDEALENGIINQKWNDEAKTKLLFLILDAPPHTNKKNISKMQNVTQVAAEKGIKIIPVVASGINKETEFLMRFIANATNGTYVFLTDDSGIGESHLEPTVGKYEVEKLNDLIIRLILKYTDNMEG